MARRRPFDLDYTIYYDKDRCKLTHDIVNNTNVPLTESDLELLASYILYGKTEETNKSIVQEHKTLDLDKRFKSYKRSDDKVKSLDELLDNPYTRPEDIKPMDNKYVYLKRREGIHRPKYDKRGNLIDPGDSDIPGMPELWKACDDLAAFIETIPPEHSYRIYRLKHQLIDMRRHQYYLKDAYKPTLRFLNTSRCENQLYDWNCDSTTWITVDEWRRRVNQRFFISKNLADYKTITSPEGETLVFWVIKQHTFDWENPEHVRQLMLHYSILYQQLWDETQSWGRTLLFDFDRYCTLCGFSPLREYILLRRIDGAPYLKIAEEMREKFDVDYTENHLGVILSKEIPRAIARKALELRLDNETPPSERKICAKCRRAYPRHPVFFVSNASRADGFSTTCKFCDKKARLRRGQPKHDQRTKGSNLPEM